MKIRLLAAVLSGVIAGQAALADPVGVYTVTGTNPDNGPAYEGAVAVERNGATYSVVWLIGDDEFVGTGIGAESVNGSMMFGSAAENDTALTVSYVSEGSFGLALFAEQPNGEWKGVWTYGGSDAIGTEVWTRQ